MATTANLAAGATPALGPDDPFTGTPPAALRYATFDHDHFSLFASNSPSQAKRALEAHLRDTDRRIQDASRLGTTLLQQRKDLSARLDDVKKVQQDNEVPDELRKKLADLEKEYNEIGKESARAFLPKSSRLTSAGDVPGTPSAYMGSGRESPTKASAPSRRQRNQPGNRVHDIEFATEISTSLLAQVRQLQSALSEKDVALKDTTSANAQLESDVAGMAQRMRHLDESEQRYKDENWNLETRLQELEASFRQSSDKEQRLTQTLKATQFEKAAAQRDLDDLKVSHERLNDEHAVIKRQQETDLHGLRRDAVSHETEKQIMRKRIEELTSQNTELARAVSSHWNQPGTATDTDFVSADEEQHTSDGDPEYSGAESPIKGTPRHSMLESETLKSSLNHAHRMIQNLKNNIHREKTEKMELKRMLQDTRDELELRRSENGIGANVAKKRRSEADSGKFRKPTRPSGLGATRNGSTEILEDDPDWEDHDGQHTPSKSREFAAGLAGAAVGVLGTAAFSSADTETSDAFETATERGGTTDAFETGRENVAGDDSDDLTETESGFNRGGTLRKRPSPLATAKAGDRRSFDSTASTSADEEQDDDVVHTPTTAQQPAKYRLRVNRGSRRTRVSDIVGESPSQRSPSSSIGTPQPTGQSLSDELDALDEDSIGGTPRHFSESASDTPETQRLRSVEPETPVELDHVVPPIRGAGLFTPEIRAGSASALQTELSPKPVYADASVMTEPWEPEKPVGDVTSGLRAMAGEVVGGALAGFGLGRLARGSSGGDEAEANPQPAAEDIPSVEATKDGLSVENDTSAVPLQQSQIVSQETVPIAPAPSQISTVRQAAAVLIQQPELATPMASKEPHPQALEFSPVLAQDMEPEQVNDEPLSPVPMIPERSARRLSVFDPPAIPGTDRAPPGAAFLDMASRPRLEQKRSQSVPTKPRDYQPNEMMTAGQVAEPKVLVDEARMTEYPYDRTEREAAAVTRAPLAEVPPNVVASDRSQVPSVPITPTRVLVRTPVADEGSQTIISGQEIERMLRNKSRESLPLVAGVASSNSPTRPQTAIGPGSSRAVDGVALIESPARTPRRPASSSSMRSKPFIVPPPLPEDHTEKIAAASKTPGAAAVGTMGPPLMPASAYKQNQPNTTPGHSRGLSSRDSTTPRAGRASRGPQSPTGTSRRSSVSSFASELDERFNMGNNRLMYPDDVKPATDPRMIQAITQTMIGEYLWKYTRKAGRSETSTTRHRRFFWIHPYTRTLYWSEKDPSTAGRDMLKAKSVAIEAVRVTTDDNTYPPGLHRKSLVVVTPGREIVFTAPTGQRHETWFNALSYLLLRTEQEKEEAEDAVIEDENEEFNPGFGSSFRRSVSRITGRSHSRVSLSSYNSRTTRTSSPSRNAAIATTAASTHVYDTPTLAQRQSTAAATRSSGTVRQSTAATKDSGRLSSITSKFRQPTTNQRGGGGGGTSTVRRGRSSFSAVHPRHSSRPTDPSEIYDASVVDDSAEDLRKVIERQERDADRLENVRACCDGKHDVGSLSRTGKHNSLTARFSSGGAGHHLHSHGHAHPGPRSDTVGSRTG